MTGRIPLAAIQRAVASHYSLPVRYLVEPDGPSGQRERHIARPRQVAMYLAHTLITTPRGDGYGRLPMAYAGIGRAFGGRDHSTVIHAVKAVEKRLLTDPEVQADVRTILNALQEHSDEPLLLEAA